MYDILIIEDHCLVADSIARLLEVHGHTGRVAHARTLREAKSVLREMRFDVIILDLVLPDATGLVALERIREVNRATPIVVLTSSPRDLRERALALGAFEFLTKEESALRLVEVVSSCVRGQSESKAMLTSREEQVAQMVAIGMTRVEVARILCLSAHTVRDHARSAMRKLGARNRMELAFAMRRRGQSQAGDL